MLVDHLKRDALSLEHLEKCLDFPEKKPTAIPVVNLMIAVV
jgi:hypothetical protein